MASNSPRNSGKTPTRRSSSKRPAARKVQTKNTGSAGQNEVILFILFAACMFMFVSTLGYFGIVGNAVGGILFGAAGVVAYAVPFIIFISAAFLLLSADKGSALKKTVALILLAVFLCGFIQLVTDGCPPGITIRDYSRIGSDYHTGGGLTGGAAALSFSRAFGMTGARILLVVLMLSCLIVITQKSYIGFISGIIAGIISIFQGAQSRYDEGRPERELKHEARHREREKIRRERREERMRRLEESMILEDEEDLPDEDMEISYESARPKSRGFLEGTELKKTAKPKSGKSSQAGVKKKTSSKPAPVIQDITEEITGSPSEKPAFESAKEETNPCETEDFDMSFETERKDQSSFSEEPVPESTTESAPVRRTRKSRAGKAVLEEEVNSVEQQISLKESENEVQEYQFPPLNLMKRGNGGPGQDNDLNVRQTARKLQETLYNFGVNAKVVNVSKGPTVTRFELQPEMGVKVASIVRLADDIKLNLAAADIRIEAPIPGKAAVGIEVPNKEKTSVMLRDLLESPGFINAKSKLAFAAGMDIVGDPVITDIAKMPHLLIAGATGSGKSVCINTLIVSILYKARPDEVKLIMIDPKVVELSVYNGIPHLMIPVVTDPKKAAGALNWAVAEMTRRYNGFAEFGVRNLKEYNAKILKQKPADGEKPMKPLPQIVVIVDELADLMMVAASDVEDAICRLAQLARAAGIHLVIATQRPSVNVITGLIKANMPSRIAFAVSSGVDSRTILDMNGAEKLLGKGDMLFYPQGYPKPARLQGALISDEEVADIVHFLTEKNPKAEYSTEIEQSMTTAVTVQIAQNDSDDRDVYFEEAGKFIIEKEKASIGMLQRMYKIGFNRAARIMDQLADAGVVGPEEGTKPRKILMTQEEFQNYLDENG